METLGVKKRREVIHDFVVEYHGMEDEVTGTCIIVEIPNENLRIMLDMGFHQDSRLTPKQQFDVNYKKFKDVDLSTITHVLVSHSHLDHVGGLPLLVIPENNFQGKVMCTEATTSLTMLNVRDSAFVMANTCKLYNRANPSKKPLEPLYLEQHANDLVLIMQGYGYNEEIPLTPNVTVTFKPCGHMLGDSSILITYNKDEYTTRRLLYTGDTNAFTQDPKPFTKQWDTTQQLDVDVLIMENTYGGRYHQVEDNVARLEELVLDHVLKNRGILLIPAFAIARSTQMVYYLKRVWERNPELQKANIPIYLAGNLLNLSHNVYSNEYFQRNYMDEQWQNDGSFKWGNVKKITKFQEVEEQLLDNKPKIIISSGGMLQGGYCVYLAQQLVGRPNVMISFVGYQGEGTVGRAILETKDKEKKTVSIQGRTYTVRCKLPKPINVSGHADTNQLTKLVKSLNQSKLKAIFLVHGDKEAKDFMKEKLQRELDMDKKTIYIPKPKDVIRLFSNNKK